MKVKRTFLIIIILIIIVAILSNKNIGILLYEMDYKINNDSESLIKLCLKLIETNKYDKKIIYYKKVLDFNEFEQLINDYNLVTETENIAELYDFMLFEYLLAHLKVEQNDIYIKEYARVSNSFINIGEIYQYLMVFISDAETNDEQLEVVLNSLQNAIPTEEGKVIDKIGNLNLQILIYEELGDLESAKSVDKVVQQIFKDLGKE